MVLQPIPKHAINTPDVGKIAFEKPSPNWNINTVVCLDISSKSPNGANIGIVNAACPDPEITKKFINIWTGNITHAASNDGNLPINDDKPNNIVSMIWEFSAIITIALANPITIAAPIISLAPSINASAISSAFNPPTIPANIPVIKNTAAISGIQNPSFNTPHMITAKQTPIEAIIILCANVNLISSFIFF